jgi:hypothetical protein
MEIKRRNIKLTRHAACMGISDVCMKCFSGNMKAICHLRVLDGDERMTVEQGM